MTQQTATPYLWYALRAARLIAIGAVLLVLGCGKNDKDSKDDSVNKEPVTLTKDEKQAELELRSIGLAYANEIKRNKRPPANKNDFRDSFDPETFRIIDFERYVINWNMDLRKYAEWDSVILA